MDSKEEKKDFFNELLVDLKKEFRKGCITLIAWSIPGIIIVFILSSIGSVTLNNKLRIDSLECSQINDNMAVKDISGELVNPTHYQEHPGDGLKSRTYSYSYEIALKGHGKIESADVFYSYKTENDMIPVKIDINNTIWRIFHVNPQNVTFQITYIKYDTDISPNKRAYLIFKDAETKDTHIYLLVITDNDGSIKFFDESVLYKMAPMDQDINNSNPELYVAFNKEDIINELIYIRSFYK